MKTLEQRRVEEYKRILASSPKWRPNDVASYPDGDFEFRPPDEFQWDLEDGRTSYAITFEDDKWFVSWFIAGPDHGIIADGEVGTFISAREAREASYRHAADALAQELHADAKMYRDLDDEVTQDVVAVLRGVAARWREVAKSDDAWFAYTGNRPRDATADGYRLAADELDAALDEFDPGPDRAHVVQETT